MFTVSTNHWRSIAAAVLVLGALFCAAPPARAQSSSLSLTVTPPLFQLSLGQGESWVSSIKVVNANDYPIDLYNMVMDVVAEGEKGRSRFIPLAGEGASAEDRSATLGNWITISPGPLVIPPGQSAQVPFAITVPAEASPGGYSAAVLLGNQPPKAPEGAQGSLVNISSYVSSLLFVRVKGEAVEDGLIRQFTTDRALYQTPEVNFNLRFENTGTVHVRPAGVITIYNMWGKKRGEVYINQKTGLGNVLPRSTRSFEFTWTGESHLFEVGRYRAEATLTYGEDEKKNVSADAYFWIVPVVPLSLVLGGFLLFVFLIVWFIRRYIRRALALQAAYMGVPHPQYIEEAVRYAVPPVPAPPVEVPRHIEPAALARPITQGVVDLRSISWSGKPEVEWPESVVHNRGSQAGTGLRAPDSRGAAPGARHVAASAAPKTLSPGQFFKRYRLFFLFIIFLAIMWFAASRYLGAVLLPEREYDIKIPKEDQTSVSVE